MDTDTQAATAGTDTPSVGELLNELRDLQDYIEAEEERLKPHKRRAENIKSRLVDISEQQGVDSFANDRISVSIKPEIKYAYDPEQWSAIVDWLADHKALHVMHRRWSDKSMRELAESGVELHPGIRMEVLSKVNTRRK